jgi:hypothetical protein
MSPMTEIPPAPLTRYFSGVYFTKIFLLSGVGISKFAEILINNWGGNLKFTNRVGIKKSLKFSTQAGIITGCTNSVQFNSVILRLLAASVNFGSPLKSSL